MIGRGLEALARHERAILVTAFTVVTTVLCGFLAFATPVGQVPDEIAHVLRADSVRHGMVVGSRWELPPRVVPKPPGWKGPVVGTNEQGMPLVALPARQEAGGLADHGVVQAAEPFVAMEPDERMTAAARAAARSVGWTGPRPADFRNTVQYPPFFYLGAAFAYGTAQALGFVPYDAAIGIRLVNIVQFLVLGAAALWLAMAGRLALFVILTLPMTLYLAASASQDGLMIATAALVAALVSRMWQQPAPSAGRLALLALLLVAVITARPSNAPLALLLLLPQPGMSWRPRLIAFAAVTLATLGWSALMAATVAVPLRPTASTAMQLAALKTDPARFFAAARQAIDDLGLYYLEEMIGRLGPLDISLPHWVMQVYPIPVAMAVLGEIVRPVVGPRTRFLAALAIIAGCALLVALAQYLTWTPVDAVRLEGVQGRYFLPVAVVIGLGMAGLVPLAARWPRGLAVLGILAGPAIGAIVLPSLTLARYYGP